MTEVVVELVHPPHVGTLNRTAMDLMSRQRTTFFSWELKVVKCCEGVEGTQHNRTDDRKSPDLKAAASGRFASRLSSD